MAGKNRLRVVWAAMAMMAGYCAAQVGSPATGPTSGPASKATSGPTTLPMTQPAGPYAGKFSIGLVTTYVKGPFNADGTVCYLAAINAVYGRDVKPADNAAMLVVRALGPGGLEKANGAAILEALGLADLPAKGECFLTPMQYAGKMHPDEASVKRWETEKSLEEGIEKALAGQANPAIREMLKGWLDANATPLALVVEATGRSRWYVPLVSSQSPATVRDALAQLRPGGLRDIAKALVVRAAMHAAKKEWADATGDLLAVHRLARLVAQSPLMGDQTTALMIENLATNLDTAIAVGGQIPADDAAKYLAALTALGEMRMPLEAIAEGQRLMMLDLGMVLVRGGLDGLTRHLEASPDEETEIPPTKVDADEFLKAVNRLCDKSVKAATQPAYAGQVKAFADLNTEAGPAVATVRRLIPGEYLYRQRLAALLKKADAKDPAGLAEAVAELMAGPDLPRPTLPRVLNDAIARERLARTAMALAIHKAGKDEYPLTLSVLAGGLLKDVPDDPFDGKPLRYAPKQLALKPTYTLYSVGPNAKDDDGENDGDSRDDLKLSPD